MSHLLIKITINLIVLAFAVNYQHAVALEGGQPVNSNDYKGLVILSYDSDGLFELNQKNCTGIVLQPRRILTTISCTTFIDFGIGVPFPEVVAISANRIKVHPVSDGKIAGIDTQSPVIKPSQLPSIGVIHYAEHPQVNYITFGSTSSYRLVVLYLDSDIELEPATLYSGANKFIDFSATALGWEIQERTINTKPVNQFVLGKLEFSLVDGSNDKDSDCYENNSVYTGTYFCSEVRDGTNNFNNYDEGGPIYRSVNSSHTVIGLLLADRNEIADYARISSMVGFIKQHAPDTKFESGAPDGSLPASQLLLLDN